MESELFIFFVLMFFWLLTLFYDVQYNYNELNIDDHVIDIY